MPRWIVKLERAHDSLRMVIPARLVREMDLKSYNYLVIDQHRPEYFMVRGFIQGGKRNPDSPKYPDNED